jgi:threonine dehydratase
MSRVAWQRTCLLCGATAGTGFAFLPNLGGCKDCENAIAQLQPPGVDPSRHSAEVFQTYSVAPKELPRIYEKVDDFVTGSPSGAAGAAVASERFFHFLETVFGVDWCLDIGVPRLLVLREAAVGLDTGNWWLADCSTLKHSGTAKDIRTLGIAYSLEGSEIRNLVSWTAGNAGQSLLAAVRALTSDRRSLQALAIHLLVSANVEPSILEHLRKQGARVTLVRTREPLSTRETVEACGGNPSDGTWLDVTDGWDEAGVLSYRLYAYFLMALHRPEQIVVPVGTGGLFVGFLLGISDYLHRHPALKASLVGAVPAGLRSTIPASTTGAEPIAPKLFGPYSPFGLVLSAVDKGWKIYGKSERLEVAWHRIDRAAQIAALRRLNRDVAASEPSATVALASALELCGQNRRGVVVNTGYGLLGTRELNFIHSPETVF